MDTMGKLRRTHYCGEVPLEPCEVTVCGFVQKIRNLGNIIFIDLRDRTGIVQLAFGDDTDRGIFEKAASVRNEYVLMARGNITPRESVNKEIRTGTVEVRVTELRVLSKAQTTPFEITNSDKVNDELKLKYRYLDLRTKKLTENILMRHKIARVTREFFYNEGFIEIETPMMMKSTPEGARDYLVPSRIHDGKFYALPQSPQIYKQLLMVAGFDKYIQLARCFRDEDLRADRQPEFTQIDLEMSFVDEEDIRNVAERWVQKLFKEVKGIDVELPLPRLTFADAMNRYGTDKPDTRFGMEIEDISDIAKKTEFSVFTGAIEAGGTVRAIVAKNAASVYTRKETDKLIEHAKGIGAKGLSYIRWSDDQPNCSFAKFLKEGQLDEIITRLGMEKGDCAFIAADRKKIVCTVLGALRNMIAKRLDIIPADKYNLVWIVEMPFFEFNDDTQQWEAAHHPFTMPLEECIPLLDTDPENVRATAFDLVLNGTELCSGSMRITDPELQNRMFEALGLTDEEIEAKFGFLVDAYKYGAPPHGGMGLGLDRISMILCGADTLRDVIAFPKVQNASELMSGCPSPVDEKQLRELHIATVAEE